MPTAASSSVQKRLDALFLKLSRDAIDAAVVTRREDIHYLSGFTGSDSLLLLSAGKRRRLFLITDARYAEEAEKTAPGFVVTIWEKGFAPFVGKLMKKLSPNRVGFLPGAMTVAFHQGIVGETGKRLPWRNIASILSDLRAVKSPEELSAIRKAVACAEKAFLESRPNWRAGMTEKEVKDDLEWAMRRNGADDAAFETIVAAGKNASLPHAHAGKGKLRPGTMLLVDFGARVGFYNSDLTRTLWVGDVPAKWRKRYAVVLAAQQAAIDLLGPGVPGRKADAAARKVMAATGIDSYFTHSLGHGVGLAVHEEPGLGHLAEKPLNPGNIVTVEPGVYFPGAGGIRIEDMAAITATGAQILTSLPKTIESQII